VISAFSVVYEDYDTFDAGDAFPLWAHLPDAHFIFFAYDDWAASSAASIFGVSWASPSRTNRTFSPLFSTLTVIIKVSCSLSFTHKTSCGVQYTLSILENFFWLILNVPLFSYE
jgi:hypothetical protein